MIGDGVQKLHLPHGEAAAAAAHRVDDADHQIPGLQGHADKRGDPLLVQRIAAIAVVGLDALDSGRRLELEDPPGDAARLARAAHLVHRLPPDVADDFDLQSVDVRVIEKQRELVDVQQGQHAVGDEVEDALEVQVRVDGLGQFIDRRRLFGPAGGVFVEERVFQGDGRLSGDGPDEPQVFAGVQVRREGRDDDQSHRLLARDEGSDQQRPGPGALFQHDRLGARVGQRVGDEKRRALAPIESRRRELAFGQKLNFALVFGQPLVGGDEEMRVLVVGQKDHRGEQVDAAPDGAQNAVEDLLDVERRRRRARGLVQNIALALLLEVLTPQRLSLEGDSGGARENLAGSTDRCRRTTARPGG